MQKSLLLHNDWLINKISSSVSSFRRVHTIINFNTKSNGSISLFLSFFFHFLFLLCEPRKWIKLPAVSHADRSLFFINKWASSLGRAAPSLYSGIYLYDRERGAEAITHRAFWWHSYEWLYSLFLCNKEREQKKKKEIRTVGSLFQIDSWGGRGRNPPRLWRGKGDPLRELQSSSPR